MPKRNSMSTAGGVLLFLGSLIYLYAVFTWYGGAFGAWLTAASFLGPFVAAYAVIGSIALFFMGIGMATGKMSDAKNMWSWKMIMSAGMALLIVTAGGSLFWMTVLGFLLTFIGAKTAMM